MQRQVFRRARRKHLALHDRLYRNRQDDQIDTSRDQLIAEIDNRLDRVRLNFGGLRAPLDSKSIEEWRSDHMIDVGSIKEPVVATGINLFVSGVEYLREDELCLWQQPLRNDRVVFERPFRGFQLRRARKHIPKIPRATHVVNSR